jgi:hypothetical protein
VTLGGIIELVYYYPFADCVCDLGLENRMNPFPPEYDLSLDEFYALQKKQGEAANDALIEKQALEFGARFKAMYVGTLTKDGEATPKTCILHYRVNRMLEIFGKYARGEIKNLPKDFQ